MAFHSTNRNEGYTNQENSHVPELSFRSNGDNMASGKNCSSGSEGGEHLSRGLYSRDAATQVSSHRLESGGLSSNDRVRSTENPQGSSYDHNSSTASPSEPTVISSSQAETSKSPEKRSLISRLTTTMRSEQLTIIFMIKGALPPAIAIAIYQSIAVAEFFTTIGYLIAIMSILGLAFLPRAKFLQNMFLNVLAACLGAAFVLLMIYTVTQARLHTTPRPGSPTSSGPAPGARQREYNSSASVVAAIWLFFSIWLVNTVRSMRPQLQLPAIIFSIFITVASTYAPTFANMQAGISFTRRMLLAFLSGFGIATGVSLFIIPITCRMIFFKQAAGLLNLVKASLAAQDEYFKNIESDSSLNNQSASVDTRPGKRKFRNWRKKSGSQESSSSPKLESKTAADVAKIQSLANAMSELYSKIHTDLNFTKRETAFGKLDTKDIDILQRNFQSIITPLHGLASVANILHTMADRKGWTKRSESKMSISPEHESWRQIMHSLHEPFQDLRSSLMEAIDHILFSLELQSRPKIKKPAAGSGRSISLDTEHLPDRSMPGDEGFTKVLEKALQRFYLSRKQALQIFCHSKGLETDELQGLQTREYPGQQESHSEEHKELFLVLEMEFLFWSLGDSILQLVKFADDKVQSGQMDRRRLLVPGPKRLKKWLRALFGVEDAGVDYAPDHASVGASGITVGKDFFSSTKDPEHLPPTTKWQVLSNYLRAVPAFIGSSESTFGLRVACATMSVGIVAFLKVSQRFFLEQRLVWAMIMISIGMTSTAGAGIFGYLGRIAGTAAAMVTSFIIWYIVDGKTAGVIVFLFLFTALWIIIIVKHQRFLIIAIISMVTQVLIIGYELQVRRVGKEVATSNGQPYYPIYLLAPYRLAAVIGGMFVAFIWTFFPYPILARSQLRQDLGKALYLLANYYSLVHTTVTVRVQGIEGDSNLKQTPGYELSKARTSVFAKQLALLTSLRAHSSFTRFEPTIGGKFPKHIYDDIINQVQHQLALITFASRSFSYDSSADPSPDDSNLHWIKDFAHMMHSLSMTSQEVTSIFALLSHSVYHGSPLPPYLSPPEPYSLSKRLESLDPSILSTRHILEPGYSAFAVMQIASSLLSEDVGNLIKSVKQLCGEMDFSFHVISTADGHDAQNELAAKFVQAKVKKT